MPQIENAIHGKKEIIVDLNVYSLTAVKKVCYKLSSDYSFQIQTVDDDKQLKVVVSFFSELQEKSKDKIIAIFFNELIDQDLRESIFRETEVVRNLILAQAFSETSLLDTDEVET